MNSKSLPCLQVQDLRIQPFTVLRMNCPTLIWKPYRMMVSGFTTPFPILPPELVVGLGCDWVSGHLDALWGVLLVSMVENQCFAKVSGDTVYYDLTSDVSALGDLDSIFSIHNVIAGIQMLFNKYLWDEECLDNDCDTGQIGRLGL